MADPHGLQQLDRLRFGIHRDGHGAAGRLPVSSTAVRAAGGFESSAHDDPRAVASAPSLFVFRPYGVVVTGARCHRGQHLRPRCRSWLGLRAAPVAHRRVLAAGGCVPHVYAAAASTAFQRRDRSRVCDDHSPWPVLTSSDPRIASDLFPYARDIRYEKHILFFYKHDASKICSQKACVCIFTFFPSYRDFLDT